MTQIENTQHHHKTYMPDEETFQQRLAQRHRRGRFGQIFYYTAITIALLALVALFGSILNQSIGAIATTFEIDPESIAGEGRSLAQMSAEELSATLIEYQGNRLPVLVREHLSTVPNELYTASTLHQILPKGTYPEGYANTTVNDIRSLDREQSQAIFAEFLRLNLSHQDLVQLVNEEVVKLEIVAAWKLSDTLLHYDQIQSIHATEFPEAQLTRFHLWITGSFLQSTMSSVAGEAGIRTAIMGTVYMMLIVICVSLPIGVGAAIYLEEYATDSWFNRLIELNVRNLAGVPSIIYGLLGLAIFVRVLAPVTSGIFFGYGVEEVSGSRIETALEAVMDVDILLDEAGNYSGVAENDLLTTAQVSNLVDVFAQYGTANRSNLRGEISEETALREISKALNIEKMDTSNPDAPIETDSGNLTVGQVLALVEALQRFSTFTIAGRTLLSASLTLALLILPIIIINAQEALRAVPNTLREASYGLGATQWQTIWRAVLPSAVPGIMTGTILAVSRAIGETAPLIVVGASTFILAEPDSPFSKFTVLPIQIYHWTSRPQGQFTASPQAQFQFIAAAGIIVLLLMVISLNAVAILLRNRYSTRY